MADQDAPIIEQESTPDYSRLANEHFGPKFHGEVKDPITQVEEETPEEIEEEEEIEELEESSLEASEEEVNEEVLEVEEPQYQEYEMSQLAELFGVEENQLDLNEEGKVVLNGKVNGEPVKANVKDLLANYQQYEAAGQRLDDAKTKANSILDAANVKSEALNEKFIQADALLANLVDSLRGDSEAIDWAKLRTNDPAEYSAKKRDFDDRAANIERMRTEAISAYQSVQAEQRQEAETQQQEHLANEGQKLQDSLPEWSDPEVAKAEKKQIAEYLVSNGYSQDELTAASDHRAIIMARKAMLFDSQQTGNNAIKKRVAKIPKVLKPGTTKSPEKSNQQKLDRLRATMISTGKVEDAHAYNKARRS